MQDQPARKIPGDCEITPSQTYPLVLTTDQRQIARIDELWDELTDIGCCDLNSALRHCMRTICGWIHAQNAFWIGAVRLNGKRDAGQKPVRHRTESLHHLSLA
jgi:hypothetical protein